MHDGLTGATTVCAGSNAAALVVVNGVRGQFERCAVAALAWQACKVRLFARRLLLKQHRSSISRRLRLQPQQQRCFATRAPSTCRAAIIFYITIESAYC